MLADHTPLQGINIPVSIYSSIPVFILDDQEKSLLSKHQAISKNKRQLISDRTLGTFKILHVYTTNSKNIKILYNMLNGKKIQIQLMRRELVVL
jgi:hypothetical protein